MLAYIIYWADIVIGKIYRNESWQYKYYPCFKNIHLAQQTGLLKVLVSTPQLEYGAMPKFYAERLKLDPECKNECKLTTDKLRIIKV